MAGHQDNVVKYGHVRGFHGIYLLKDAVMEVCRDADFHNFAVGMLMGFNTEYESIRLQSDYK